MLHNGRLLFRLGFNLIVKHPYGPLVNYLQVLGLTGHPTVPQRAWGFVNDLYGLSGLKDTPLPD